MSERVVSGPPQPQGVGEDPLAHWTRVFTRFLQVVFATFEKGAYRWNLDQQNTDIIITGEATVDRQVVEKRPAIIVQRGGAAWGNVSMDQFLGFDAIPGRRKHTDLISGSVTYNCLSSEGIEAGRVAWIACYATRVLKRTLMKAGLHRVGEELSVGPESAPGTFVPGDPKEITMVSVMVPFWFQDSWSVEPVDKTLLNEISLAVRSEAGYPAPGAVPIRAPGIHGRVLTYDKLVSIDSEVKVPPVGGPRPRK